MTFIEGLVNRISTLTSLMLSFLLIVVTLLGAVGNHVQAQSTELGTNGGFKEGTTAPTPIPSPATSSCVLINEVFYDAPPGWGEPESEWIELYNPASSSITLTNWTITDNYSSDTITVAIPGKDFAIVAANEDIFKSHYPDFMGAIVEVADGRIGNGLSNSGDRLILKDSLETEIDKMSYGDDATAFDPPCPGVAAGHSLERSPTGRDTDAASDFIDQASPSPGSGITPTPTPTATFTPTPAPPPAPLLIDEVCYDGAIVGEGDEFVEILNPTANAVSLSGYKIGDEETKGGREGMHQFPADASIGPGGVLVVAKSADKFHERFGFHPDFEFADLQKYTAWASGSWALSNKGDEVLLLGPSDQMVDTIAYKSGDYQAVGVTGYISAPAPRSLQRIEDWDSDKMRADFVIAEPNPSQRTLMPTSPPVPPSPSFDGMHAYLGCLHSHSTYSDGSGPPRYAYAVGRANGLHFLVLTDHSHMCSDEEWADILTRAEEATVDGAFVGLRGFEWTHKEVGHVNVFETDECPSRDDPNYDTLEEFYAWLAGQEGAVAQFNHPFYDCDFDDFAYDAAADEKIIALEVGNGGDPYYTFEEAYLRALYAGWHVGPANNGDTETPDWGADTPHRTGILAPNLTKSDLLQALRARRVFATEDANCALALRAGDAWMGSTVEASNVTFQGYYHDADGEGATLELFDRSLLVASTNTSSSIWSVTVPAAAGHYYFAKATQEDGDVAYTSPIWVEGTAAPEEVIVNEVLPAPSHEDWDGDGTADYNDEWIELHNPSQVAIGLGGWQLDDEADGGSAPYTFPLGTAIQPGGFLVLFKKNTGIALDNGGDWARLLRPNGSLADQFHYTRSPGYDKSWSRTESGDWTDFYPPSPGRENKPAPKPKPSPPIPTPTPISSTIAGVKTLAKGTKVIVEGQVIVWPGPFGEKTLYIQDETAGIMVYLSRGDYPQLEEGDWVRIEGVVWEYKGESEIKVYGAGNVQRLGPGEAVAPTPIDTGQVGEALEGKLVQVTGRITRFGSFYLDDGSGEVEIYIRRGTGIELEGLQAGQIVTAVGVVGQFGSTHEIRPRSQADIESISLPATGSSSPRIPMLWGAIHWIKALLGY